MATRGKPIPAQTVRHIQQLRAATSVRKAARAADVDKNTVMKYTRKQSP